jgi:chromosome partitioning protein
MTTVAVITQKGGVGKTTLALHMAIYFASVGKHVSMIDADPQGNATSFLLDGDLLDAGLFNLLVIGKPLLNCMRFVTRWNIGLLPGNARTDEAMRFLTATGKLNILPDSLKPLTAVSDLVIVDMPPSRAAGFEGLLMACDWVLVPTELERFALEGVSQMAEVTENLYKQGRGPRLLGVVPNKARHVNEHTEQLKMLADRFGAVVWPPIPLSIQVAMAASYSQSLFEAAPNEPVTLAMLEVANRMNLILFGDDHA